MAPPMPAPPAKAEEHDDEEHADDPIATVEEHLDSRCGDVGRNCACRWPMSN